jgi:hypothetical protein
MTSFSMSFSCLRRDATFYNRSPCLEHNLGLQGRHGNLCKPQQDPRDAIFSAVPQLLPGMCLPVRRAYRAGEKK